MKYVYVLKDNIFTEFFSSAKTAVKFMNVHFLEKPLSEKETKEAIKAVKSGSFVLGFITITKQEIITE